MTKFFYLLFSCSLFFNLSMAQVATNADGKTQAINSRENAPSTNLVQCNAFAITGPATSGAFRAPNSRFRSGRLAYIVTAAEMTAAAVANGQQITGIGWVNTIAPGIAATGNFKLYLQNSSDVVYSKSTDWATAITGMTTAHDGTLTIPDALDCNLTSFTGGSAFTYTGASVYVAFEWTYCVGTLSTAQSSGCNNALVGGANGSASLQSLTTCTPGTLLVTSAFRPVTKFFFDCHTNDIRVNTIYSMGKLAVGHSNNHAVSAYVSNIGTDPVTNIPVTLNVTGVNTFSNTQTIPSLAAGQAIMVTFPPYTPATLGNNDVAVSVPADDVNSNNSQSISQVVSLEEIGIKSASEVSNTGAGFTGTTGVIASRFNTATGGLLKSVRVAFNTANGSTYRVAIYGDNGGIPSNTALYTDAANRTVTAAGDVVLELSPSVNLPAGNFYVAIQQLSTINMALRFTVENPLRAGQIFVNSVDLTTGWSDNSPAFTFRYNIDAIFYPYSITSSAGAGGTISPTGIIGVDNNGSQVFTITPNAGFNILDVLVDGLSVGPVNVYSFTNITGNHTITVSFAIIPTIPPAPVVSGITNVCPYLDATTPVTYTASSAGATNYTWVLPPNVNIVSGQGTANLVVTFNPNFNLQGNKQIKVTASSISGSSPQVIFYLVTQAPGTPAPFIAATTQVCSVIGTPDGLTYTIRKVTGATSYNWQAQAGTTVITHPNGPGLNDTTVTITFTSGFTTSAVSVQSTNGCGTSATRSIMVYRNNPSAPSLVTGPTNVCEFTAPDGVPATYSVTLIAGITYNWIVPAGSTGLVGQGTNSISFTFPAGFTAGAISVTATNGCGTSAARILNVSVLPPSTPGTIAVVNTVTCADPGQDRIFTYTLPAMPNNATSIMWTVPAGAVLISGQGTTSITVIYPPTVVVGTVTAQAINNCGISGIRTVNVNLPECPPDFAAGRGLSGVLMNDVVKSFDVQAYPNPAIGEFKLQMNTADRSNLVAIRILDAQGRELKRVSLKAAPQLSIGNDLKTGVYIIEVTQGGNRKILSVVKL